MTLHEALLRDLYEAFNRKDIAAIVGSLCADVDWPNVQGEGRLSGPDAVAAMWRIQFMEIDPEASPIRFRCEPDGRVEVTINYVVRTLDGKVFTDEISTNTFRFRDGLIAGMEWG